MIKLRFSTIDGIRKAKTFKTLDRARKAAHDWVGADADLGATYAVSTDGVVKVTAEGCSLNDLFGTPKAAPAAPATFIAKRKSADSYELYCGKICPMNLIGKAFKAFDTATGDHEDGWAITGLGGAYDAPLDTDKHYPTLQAALAEAKSIYQGWQEYLAEESAAEQYAEGAWLRHAEMGTMESQRDEDMERTREAAFH